MFFSLETLASKVNRTAQTLRLHIRRGWLKAEKMPGAKGWRVSEREAKKWAAKYLGIEITNITTLNEP